jgi:hypothetical protein
MADIAPPTAWIRHIHRVVSRIDERLLGLVNQGVRRQELTSDRVVVAGNEIDEARLGVLGVSTYPLRLRHGLKSDACELC